MNFEQVKGALFDALLEKSFETHAVEEEKSQLAYLPPCEGEVEALALFDEADRDILMHRDAHFASSFPLMAEYYENEGKGAVLDVDVERIRELEKLQEELGRDLAPLVLQGADAEKVARARSLYKTLRQQCEKPISPAMKACAELILSEEDPEVDARSCALFGPVASPILIQLIQTEELYDPLFPGYGKACSAACKALGLLKAKEALAPLFMVIGQRDFDIEQEALSAIAAFGEPAKQFCLKMLRSRPLTFDNERAAIALSFFEIDEEIKNEVGAQLGKEDVQRKKTLVRYLENLYQDS